MLMQILQGWQGKAVNTIALRQLKKDRAGVDLIVKLLAARAGLKEQASEVYDAMNGTPTARGIAACLLESAGDYDAILSGTNNESKSALLSCARLIRAKLPVAVVAEMLKNPDKQLALAADEYLESEDSLEARQIILTANPNQARILGARAAFMPPGKSITLSPFLPALFAGVNSGGVNLYGSSALEVSEKKLKKELADDQTLQGIYSYNNNFIRMYADKALFSWQDDPSRYYERNMTRQEFERLHNYLSEERVDEYPPFLSNCGYCDPKEFLMFGRAGGRRIFFQEETPSKLSKDLDGIFKAMQEQPGAKLHYWLEKYIPGLEILFADESLKAKNVWKGGEDVRLLVDDEGRREAAAKELEKLEEEEQEGEDFSYEKWEPIRRARREKSEFETMGWFRFDAGKPLALSSAPDMNDFIAKRTGQEPEPGTEQWKARTKTFELRTSDEGNLMKVSNGRASLVLKGGYSSPVVTPDGAWALVLKFEEYRNVLYRVNLATNREFKVAMPGDIMGQPIAFVPSQNKMLIMAGTFYGEEGVSVYAKSRAAFYLMDPATGVIQKVNGDVRPLWQQTSRPLQNASAADTFWAAVTDEKRKATVIGLYNAKLLMFKEVLVLPTIEFTSMDLWVDEAAKQAYIVYEGQLLRVPLTAGEPARPAGGNVVK
jgi:hypothetical protein